MIIDFLLNLLANAVFTGILVLGAGFLFRESIKTRLQASIKHEFDTKFAELQADLRKSEELFKAELRKKEAEIQALQSGALSTMVSRQVAIDKRRLEAIDQLWAGFNALTPARGIASYMAVIDFDKSLKEIAKEPKIRKVFEAFGKIDLQTMLVEDAWKARPHVSSLAWAYFAAYRSVVGISVAMLHQLQVGIEGDFLDRKGVVKMVKLVLPHHAEHLDKFGASVLPQFLEELEQSLLTEFGRMLSGVESDAESVASAKKILIAVEMARKEQTKESLVSKEIDNLNGENRDALKALFSDQAESR